MRSRSCILVFSKSKHRAGHAHGLEPLGDWGFSSFGASHPPLGPGRGSRILRNVATSASSVTVGSSTAVGEERAGALRAVARPPGCPAGPSRGGDTVDV